MNGQTYKQTFRVERVSGGGDAGFQFGEDENHDQLGRYHAQGGEVEEQVEVVAR